MFGAGLIGSCHLAAAYKVAEDIDMRKVTNGSSAESSKG